MNYTPIHVHSDYSLLDSATKFEQLADAAKACGMKAIATTEHGLHRGYIHKKLYCDSIGIKLLFGVEVYMTEQLEPKVRDNYHTILIAKNQEGLKELNKLIRLSTTENHTFYKNRISFTDFMSISSNIITTSACIASPLNRISEENPWFEKLVMKYDYLEIQPHPDPKQAEFNRKLYELSKKYNKPLVVGTDTHSLDAYAAECRKVLQEAKEMSFDDEDSFDLTFKNYDEVVEMFRRQNALPEDVYLEALENTNRIADSCEDFKLDTSIKYPILHGSYEKDVEVFEETVTRMFEEKLASGVIPRSEEAGFRESINEEMRVLKKLNMCGLGVSSPAQQCA